MNLRTSTHEWGVDWPCLDFEICVNAKPCDYNKEMTNSKRKPVGLDIGMQVDLALLKSLPLDCKIFLDMEAVVC